MERAESHPGETAKVGARQDFRAARALVPGKHSSPSLGHADGCAVGQTDAGGAGVCLAVLLVSTTSFCPGRPRAPGDAARTVRYPKKPQGEGRSCYFLLLGGALPL